MSKAVIFFAQGLEECEALLCVDILRRAGVEVTIAAVGKEHIVTSARQVNVVADALAEELDYAQFDACILPGGIPGVPNLKADTTVRQVCTDFAAAGKKVCAICAAPTALAAFGVLQGRPDRRRGRLHRPAADHRRQHHHRRGPGRCHPLCLGYRP